MDGLAAANTRGSVDSQLMLVLILLTAAMASASRSSFHLLEVVK